MAARVASAGIDAGSPSSLIIDGILRPKNQTASFQLWHALAKIRRHRADAHASAWTEAGHTAASIQGLGHGPERAAIEDRTNEINSSIWATLNETEQLQLVAGLAGLNGIGNPS